MIYIWRRERLSNPLSMGSLQRDYKGLQKISFKFSKSNPNLYHFSEYLPWPRDSMISLSNMFTNCFPILEFNFKRNKLLVFDFLKSHLLVSQDSLKLLTNITFSHVFCTYLYKNTKEESTKFHNIFKNVLIYFDFSTKTCKIAILFRVGGDDLKCGVASVIALALFWKIKFI